MIDNEDVKKLARLARIEVTDDEAKKFVGEIESILNYVGEVKNVEAKEKNNLSLRTNIFRTDSTPHPARIYTEDIISAAPQAQAPFIVVKKIL